MNQNRIGIAILAAAMALPAAALAQSDTWMVAQMDPNNPQPNPTPGSQGGVQSPGPSRPASVTDDSSMRSTLGAPGETGQQMRDQQFLRKATDGGLAQVELGKLATAKGSPDVKELGQKLVDDHTAMNKDMGGVADSLGVMLPKKLSKDDQAEYDKLNSLNGDAFDKEYIAYVLKDHIADMRDYRVEATTAADESLRAQSAKSLGMMRQHMQMVAKVANEKGVPLPARPQRQSADAK